MKSALITGVTGQDGSYLAKLLLEKGYKVYGTFRRLSTPNFWRLQYLDIFDKVNLVPCDMTDMSSLIEAIQISSPQEVYNLAAQSFVAAAFEQPLATGQVDGLAVTMLLEAIRHTDPSIKFYQASTSELYGNNKTIWNMDDLAKRSLNENSGFAPASPYAAAKLYSYWIVHIYRQAYKLHASQGILFNHESPIRGLEFVTRKISNGVAKIANGIEKTLTLGDISNIRDWGYAPEYVEGMWKIMQQDQPDDYVLATNEFHSVKQFAELACEEAGINFEKSIKTDKRFMRPLDVKNLRGDYSKAKQKLGWEPKTSFEKLVKIMVKADVERWGRVLKGEWFPWDAPNYPSEAKIITRSLKG